MTPPTSSASSPQRFVIVVGGDRLATRLAITLNQRYGLRVHVIRASADDPSGQTKEIQRAQWEVNPEMTVSVAEGNLTTAIWEAGFAESTAVALMDEDEAVNLRVLFDLRDPVFEDAEWMPRFVIRVNNAELGSDLGKVVADDACTAVSETEVVARTFTAAAAGYAPPGELDVWGRTVRYTYDHPVRSDAAWRVAAWDGRISLLESSTSPDDVLLWASLEPVRKTRRRLADPTLTRVRQGFHHVLHAWETVRRMSTKGLWIGSLALAALFTAGTFLLARYPSPAVPVNGGWDAAYVLALIAAGGTDPDLAAHPWVRITHAVVVIAGSLFVPVVTGAVVQAVIDRRDARAEGRIAAPVRDHVIVVGLGDLGVHVVRALRDSRVPVVAIDRDPRAPGVREARFAGAQVLLGDGHDQAILREAEIGHARSLVAAMPDGIESLKIILATARANPALATVQRLSSEGLVYSIHTNLNDGGKPGRVQHTSIDAAHIAAEFFATQFGTTTVIDMINVQNRLAVIAEVPVAESSELEEVTVADVDENRMFQVLAVQRQDKDVQWNPHSDFLVHSGDTLLILAALDHLWQVAARARPSNWHS